MADEDSMQEKTEEATQQRREDYRKQGQVAQSKEVASVLVLFGVALAFYFSAKHIFSILVGVFNNAFTDGILKAARMDQVTASFQVAFYEGLKIILPIFAVTAIMGVVSSVIQIGFLASWERLTPDVKHINPISGFKRLFSLRGIVEGLKAIFKITIVLVVGYMVIQDELKLLPTLVQMSVPQLCAYVGWVLFKLVATVCVFMTGLAGLDYFYQWFEMEKKMKMTKQEVKEEFKQREGDPLIKARIKRVQRDLAQKRMMESVPKADVIITNPTHLAVALQYDRDNMAAPTVIAKGADLVARKIKEIARANNVPIVENKPLARTMFKTLKIGQAIPKSLYNAVAEVLAYVYRLKGKAKEVANSISQEGGGLNG